VVLAQLFYSDLKELKLQNQLHVSALRPSSGWILGFGGKIYLLQRLVGQVGCYGGLGDRDLVFTVLCVGVCTGWVWQMLVGVLMASQYGVFRVRFVDGARGLVHVWFFAGEFCGIFLLW
jgi:hypothetical protein